jgi:carboxymethylenebutenolidase
MAAQYINMRAGDGGSFRGYLATPSSGTGPGLVIAQEIFGINKTMRDVADDFAEEGYVALVPDLFWRQQPNVELGYTPADWQKAFDFFEGFDEAKGMQDMQTAITALRARAEVGQNKVGVLGFCLGGKLAYLAACRTDADVAVGYYGVGIDMALPEADKIKKPLLLHIAELDKFCPPEARERVVESLQGHPAVSLYIYAGVEHAFARLGGEHFERPAALMAHERSIAALKSAMGPHYDLSALWDKHCEYEFGSRNVGDTMKTMVPEPYVNHIPTMTGGVGYQQLHRFYSNYFVNSNPPDTRLTSISRTIGATQVVDELLFSFTHTTEIPWMLPGVAPTGRRVEVPLLAVIKFRGNKLYHEHIYWDQASVLVQVGLLDSKLLPVAGVETACKLLDETLPSNSLVSGWK